MTGLLSLLRPRRMAEGRPTGQGSVAEPDYLCDHAQLMLDTLEKVKAEYEKNVLRCLEDEEASAVYHRFFWVMKDVETAISRATGATDRLLDRIISNLEKL